VSRIFDALRKSEQDRTGAARPDASPQPAAWSQAAAGAQTPVAGLDMVPAIHSRPENGFPDEAGDASAETFRVLRHRLELIRRRRHLQKLLVTSAIPKEGKTTVACRLAMALAQTARVLLVDADLRHPGVHRTLGIPAHKGVGDWLEHREELPAVLRRVEPYGFFYLPAGEAHSNPGELLRQPALAEFLAATEANFDWVLVDSPPLGPFVDAHHLATLVDGALVVLRRGVTPRSVLAELSVSLERVFVAGAILNGARDSNQGYYEYYGRERTIHSRGAMPPPSETDKVGVSLHD